MNLHFLLCLVSGLLIVFSLPVSAAPIFATTNYDELDPAGGGSVTGISFVWEFTWNGDYGIVGAPTTFAPPTAPAAGMPDVQNFWRSTFKVEKGVVLREDRVVDLLEFSSQHVKRPAGAEHIADVEPAEQFVGFYLRNLGDTRGFVPLGLFEERQGVNVHDLEVSHLPRHHDLFYLEYDNPPGAGDIKFRFTGVHSSVPEPTTLGLIGIGVCGFWVRRKLWNRPSVQPAAQRT